MQLKRQHCAGFRRYVNLAKTVGVLFGAIVLVSGSFAQGVSGSPAAGSTGGVSDNTNAPLPVLAPTPLAQPPPTPTQGTSQLAGEPPPLPGGTPLSVPNLLRWGPVVLRPHFDYRFFYSEGILYQPGHPINSFVNQVSPGMFFELGKHWILDYTPSLFYYSSSLMRNTLDNFVTLSGGTTYEDWTFGLTQVYSSYSQPLVETGSQTDQQNYLTTLSASDQLSSKVALQLGLYQSLRYLGQSTSDGQPLQNYQDWGTMDWLDYQLWPRFHVALGAGGGYTMVSAGSDMTYEQLQGRISWTVVEKLKFVLSGGMDDRQFLGSGLANALNPIFNGKLEYRISDTTLFDLSASRSVSPSFYANQLSESTSVGANLNQRLLKKLHLSLGGGYRSSTYTTTSATVVVDRRDNGPYFLTQLQLQLFLRATFSIFYYWNDNNSTLPGYTYSSSQAGLELGYRF